MPLQALALLLSGVGAHANTPIPSLAGAATALLLGTLAHSRGWPIPIGGSKAIPDAAVRESAKTFVHYKDLSALRQEMSGGNGTLAFTIDKVAVSLKYGEHFFLGSNEAAKAGVL